VATLLTPRTRILHNPKCGGTWVWRALEAAGVEVTVFGDTPVPNPKNYHLDLAGTNEYADRFTIAFIRHPLDWWRSMWGYRMRTGWDLNRRVDSVTHSEDFNTFIEHVVERLPGHLSPEFARYIGPPSRPIEFIGRFEMLVDDLVRGLREAGENFDEQVLRLHPPDNVNDYARFPAVYRRNVAARLAESERAVIDRFYFDEPIPAWLVAPPEPLRRRLWKRTIGLRSQSLGFRG
jgi:hypothetical protein